MTEMTALQMGREDTKGRITSARTAKPNSEKQVLQRVTQIHMMFSKDHVFTGGGAVHSAIWPKAMPTLAASYPAANMYLGPFFSLLRGRLSLQQS